MHRYFVNRKPRSSINCRVTGSGTAASRQCGASCDYKVLKGNCILVGGKTFTITYQEDDFISNDRHKFVLIAKKPDITKNQYMFLI